MPARRALLFMPGDDRRKIEKAAALPVDSVIMDMEDGVAYNRKAQARQSIAAALQTVDFGSRERLIRTNPVSQKGWFKQDIRATVAFRPDGYVLPKVETAAQVQLVSKLLSAYEAQHAWPQYSLRLLAIVETALGIVNLREIAASDPRLDALALGAEDLAADIGALRTRAENEVAYARSALVIHAKAFNLQALDTPYVYLEDSDLEGLEQAIAQAVNMGYDGKLAIHPKHVALIQAGFAPPAEAVAAAQRLIAAYDAHQAAGSGVFVWDGKMIDAPMLKAARRLLARAAPE